MANTDAKSTLSPEGYIEICEVVRSLDEVYYATPDLVDCDDAEYDRLFDLLLEYEQENGASEDSPTLRVAGKSSRDDVPHPVPMLSLEKVTTLDDLAAFVRRCDIKDWDKTPILVEPKYDGASLSLHYEGGVLMQALTRGDGTHGTDVTQNAGCIVGIPRYLPGFTGTVRGEVMIRRKDFLWINEKREEAGEQPFANTRNAAAGALTNSDPREARRRKLVFYLYDIITEDEDHDAWQWFTMRGEVMSCLCPRNEGEVIEFVEALMEKRPSLEFDTDGVVIKMQHDHDRHRLGAKDRHPNWAMAFKAQGETAHGKLLDVEWQVGVGGAITPVARIETTLCAGTVIRNITLHNFKFIRDFSLQLGDVLVIRRAGDVIPQVIDRIEGDEHRDLVTRRIARPKGCPSCGMPVTRSGNSDQIRCSGLGCPAQIVGKLVHWASRNAMDIDAIGPKWMERFFGEFNLIDVSELYTITKEELLTLDGMGEVNADRFISSIEASKDRGMARVLFGLSIPEVGEGTAKRLARSYADIDEIAGSGVESLMMIDGIGQIVAQSIVGWFATHSNCQILKMLHQHGVVMEAPMLAQSTSETKTFVLTGSIEGYSNRKAFAEVLEGEGWVMQSGVSKKTDLLITDDTKQSSKMKKAADLGVQVLTSTAALEMARA